MAQSRLEKVGTIYSRATSLIKSGALKEETRPMWLDLYKAFPPKYEPRYDRISPSTAIKQIFYAEDCLRARFHSEYKHFAMINMTDNSVSRTEQFLVIYKQLETKGIPESELYEKAVEEFLANFKIEQALKEEARNIRIAQAKTGKNKFVKKIEEGKPVNTMDLSENEKQKFKPIKFSLEKILKDSDEGVKSTDKGDKKPES